MKSLKVIGAGWAIVGAANILVMSTKTSSEGILTFGLIFNMVLFVLPGLAVYGIGKNGEKASRKKRTVQIGVTREELRNRIIVFLLIVAVGVLAGFINHRFFK